MQPAKYKKVYLIFWVSNYTKVLEVWDDFDSAVLRRDKYLDKIKKRNVFRKIQASLSGYPETCYIEAHEVKHATTNNDISQEG